VVFIELSVFESLLLFIFVFVVFILGFLLYVVKIGGFIGGVGKFIGCCGCEISEVLSIWFVDVVGVEEVLVEM